MKKENTTYKNWFCRLIGLNFWHSINENKHNRVKRLLHTRAFFHFDSGKQVSIEICSRPSFHWYMSVDGCDADLKFSFWFIFSFWITFHRFLPKSWYPRKKHDVYGSLPEEKEIGVRFHHYKMWVTLWKDDDYSYHKSWRKFIVRPFDWISKTKCENKDTGEFEDYLLPFLEGNYWVRVHREYWEWKAKYRIFAWFLDKKGYRYVVKAGYGKGAGFTEVPIPVEGKGENSWDCDEDARWSVTFGLNKHFSFREAALDFWQDTMKDRIRHGGRTWIPKKFRDANLKLYHVTEQYEHALVNKSM